MRLEHDMECARHPANLNFPCTCDQPCEHADQWFDRTFCACGSMHHYCVDCGERVGPCAVEPYAPIASAAELQAWAEMLDRGVKSNVVAALMRNAARGAA